MKYARVTEAMADDVRGFDGCEVLCGARVEHADVRPGEVILRTPQGDIRARNIVNCAGLQSDRVARMCGMNPEVQIIPFRGDYYDIVESRRHLCRNLIYPVPDARFPFLGVHYTRSTDDSVECGPNAVLAFGREAYSFFRANPRDLLETLTYRGFLRMAARHWRMGLGEMWRSLNKGAFVRALQRLVPDIRAEHLEPAPAGIRAQMIAPDGGLVDDFLVVEGERVVSVCNTPSPAATASLQIGEVIVDRLAPRFG